jgi:uncharacterized DUF497 family protein
MPSIRRLIWDAWNIAHIARHDVTSEEVEEVCHGDAFFSENTYKGRIRVIGPNATGRLLTVILAPEGQGIYYPVTARPASRKERQRYREYYRDITP